MAATSISKYLPSQFLMQTWLPGLSFFAIGFLFSQWQVRWPVWAAVPLFVATVLLAPLNHGCTFSFTETCGTVPFGIRMFAGSYGFLPMFFLSSLVGSLMVVCLSTGLARLSVSSLLAYIGKNSLELFFINGFVATFLFGFFWQMEWPPLTVLAYFGLFIGIIAAHLLALISLEAGFVDDQRGVDLDFSFPDAHSDRRFSNGADEGSLNGHVAAFPKEARQALVASGKLARPASGASSSVMRAIGTCFIRAVMGPFFSKACLSKPRSATLAKDFATLPNR